MLDTHRTVKRLIQAGFSSEQAETVTDVLQETRTSDLSDLATKGDLRTLEAALKADIQTLTSDLRTVETTLKADLRTVEASLTAKIADGNRTTLQWVVGLIVAQSAIMAGLVKLIAGH